MTPFGEAVTSTNLPITRGSTEYSADSTRTQ